MFQSGLSRLRQARGAVCTGTRVSRCCITLLASRQFLSLQNACFQKHKMVILVFSPFKNSYGVSRTVEVALAWLLVFFFFFKATNLGVGQCAL